MWVDTECCATFSPAERVCDLLLFSDSQEQVSRECSGLSDWLSRLCSSNSEWWPIFLLLLPFACIAAPCFAAEILTISER